MRVTRRVALVTVLAAFELGGFGIAGAGLDADPQKPLPYLAAYDLETGEREWRNVAAQPGIRFALFEDHGLVYAEERGCFEEPDTGLAWFVAFDAASGHERWRVPVEPTGSYLQEVGPGQGTVVVLTRSQVLTGLDARTGETRWQLPLEAGWEAVGTEDLVLLKTTRHDSLPFLPFNASDLRALDRRTGELRWIYPGLVAEPITIFETQVVSRDTAVLNGTEVRAIDLGTGRDRWVVARNYPVVFRALSKSPLMFSYDANAFVSQTAYDVESMRELWATPRYDEPGGVPSPVIVTDHVVLMYTGSSEGSLVLALDAATGDVLWQKSRHGLLNVDFLGARHGRIFERTFPGLRAIDADTGEPVWTVPEPKAMFRAFVGSRLYVSGSCTSALLD